jgi:hypothetical protein
MRATHDDEVDYLHDHLIPYNDLICSSEWPSDFREHEPAISRTAARSEGVAFVATADGGELVREEMPGGAVRCFLDQRGMMPFLDRLARPGPCVSQRATVAAAAAVLQRFFAPSPASAAVRGVGNAHHWLLPPSRARLRRSRRALFSS